MSSIPRGLLRQMAGGDRPKDRWEPPTNKSSPIRLYRYEATIEIAGAPSVEKRLFSVRMLHFNGAGQAPTECEGGMACVKCRKNAMLQAQGTPDALEEADKNRPTPCPTFVIVPLDEPTRFRLFDPRFSAFQGIMLGIAVVGGWRGGGYPDPKAWTPGDSETGDLFDRCVEQGVEKVCGPNGRDMILSPKSKGKGYTWTVQVLSDGNSVLPFPEDGNVLNPEAVQARIKAAMDKKNQKEGD